jgi:hypothetical protein
MEKDELKSKMETVQKNYYNVKGKMLYATARCVGEQEENPYWEDEYEPFKPPKKKGGLGEAINSNIKAVNEEYSQNLNLDKGVTVRQMMTIDPRQKPVLDIPRIRREHAFVERVLAMKERKAAEAHAPPEPSVVSLGSDAGKMVRTQTTRRKNLQQTGRSALQRRQLERVEMDVEDSDEEKGVEWDPNVTSSSEEESIEDEKQKPVTFGDVILYS